MPAIAPAAINALLRQVGVVDGEQRIALTAVALAESGGEVSLVVGTRRGIWLVDDTLGYDRQRMVTDAAYAASSVNDISQGGTVLKFWPTFESGRYLDFINAARQAEAQSASVVGSVLDPDGSYVPGDYSTQPAVVVPQQTSGVVVPVVASYEQDGPLTGLRITGTDLTADVSSIVLGDPQYKAGWTTVPNLAFDLADPEGDLLWRDQNLWVRGARVTYLDLDLRIDTIEFSPGPATTGQLSISAIDGIIYSLQLLRGARTAHGVSATDWIRQELALCGYDPALAFLGEALPTQSEIARDIPDQAGSSDSGDIPSAWTTIQRLAKETGKRVFISGRKLIFGSAAFAMNWTAPGDLRIGWHETPDGEKWQNLPSGKQTSVGDRQGVTEVTGKVPLNRARYFRPGVSVIVHNTPSIAAGDRQFVCSDVAFTLSRDIDGADITLIEPVELTAEAAAATT